MSASVKVAELRRRIDRVFHLVTVDLPATADHAELMTWAERCSRASRELATTECARASSADWAQLESALDASANAILGIRSGRIRRAPVAPRLRVVR